MKFQEILKSKLVMCILIFIVVSLIAVIAGDVIVREGAIDVSENLDVSGNITTTGTITDSQSIITKEAVTGDVNLIIRNTAGAGSGDETASLIAQTATSNFNMGKIVFGRVGFYTMLSTRISFMDFYTTNAGTDTLALRINNLQDFDFQANDLVTTGKIRIGAGSSTYPLTVIGNVSGISIWSDGNVSATGYLERTSVYDKSQGSALGFIQDADYYKTNGEIDHSKFYGYTAYEVPDYSKPETEEYDCEDENGKSVTCERTIYPNTKIEEGASLGAEIDVLRQAVYELKTQNYELKTALCSKDNSYAWC